MNKLTKNKCKPLNESVFFKEFLEHQKILKEEIEYFNYVQNVINEVEKQLDGEEKEEKEKKCNERKK